MNKDLPIIIAPHEFEIKNAQDIIFVPLMAASLKLSNPNAQIVFPKLGKISLGISGVDEFQINPSEIKGIQELTKNYVHLSTNHADFELFCMKRFFILHEIMLKMGIEKAFIVETDVLYFGKIQNHFSTLEHTEGEVYLSENKCISTSLITLSFLKDYCTSILNLYNNSSHMDALQSWHRGYRESGHTGGVCDMTFCSYMQKGAYGFPRYVIKDMSRVYQSASGELRLVDSFIGRTNHTGIDSTFVMRNSPTDGKVIKEIRWINGDPTALLNDGRNVIMDSLHFQGNAKSLMGLFFSRWICP